MAVVIGVSVVVPLVVACHLICPQLQPVVCDDMVCEVTVVAGVAVSLLALVFLMMTFLAGVAALACWEWGVCTIDSVIPATAIVCHCGL